MKITVDDNGAVDTTEMENIDNRQSVNDSAFAESRSVGNRLGMLNTVRDLPARLDSLRSLADNIADDDSRKLAMMDIDDLAASAKNIGTVRDVARALNDKGDADVNVSDMAASYINSSVLAQNVLAINVMTRIHEGNKLNSAEEYAELLYDINRDIRDVEGNIDAILIEEGFYDYDEYDGEYDEYYNEYYGEYDEYYDEYGDDYDDEYDDEAEDTSGPLPMSIADLLDMIGVTDNTDEYRPVRTRKVLSFGPLSVEIE